MNCRNCGAPMQLFERRRYYFCTFCGTFSFIDTPEVEGVRVLARPVAAPGCPLCRAPLAKALLGDDYPIAHCEQCRGILLERTSFAAAVTCRRAREPGEPAPPVPLDPRELKRLVGRTGRTVDQEDARQRREQWPRHSRSSGHDGTLQSSAGGAASWLRGSGLVRAGVAGLNLAAADVVPVL